MLGLDDIFIGFIVSYLAGSLPSLKSIFSKKDNKPLQDHVDKGYDQAVEKWSANDKIRKGIIQERYASVGQLQELYGTPDWYKNAAIIGSLIELWASELRDDLDCAHYIQSQEFGSIGDKIDKLTELLQSKTEEVITYTGRGRCQHQPVEDYIRRYCASDHNENDFFLYALGNKERHTLADYVVGLDGNSCNKYILYSSAQTGKTTELQQLCWELQQSGLFLPVSYEVRRNTNLKREHLPVSQFIGQKEIVIIIDALDEVNGQKYEDILEEISGYAYDHPEMKMVLSCRSNYRREKQLDIFKELFLEELSPGDAQDHIEKQLGRRLGKCLIKLIIENQLNDFVRNPFFLNVLIDAFREDSRSLPTTKADFYRLFIEKSYYKEKEDKCVSVSINHSFDESVLLLERIALGMSLMNVQSLGRQELCQCLNNSLGNLEECLRYDLLRKDEDERYSFKHNAFREWLVAHYLNREGLTKAKQFATHPNGRIKPEWFNIIMLWLSMYGEDRKEDILAILDWLKDKSLDLVIYIDREMLDEKTRNQVFKGLLLEYKSLGIRMSNIMSQDYKNLLAFGKSEETIRFLIDETKEAVLGTAYYADLICICYFLDWESLERGNKKLTEELFLVLVDKTREALARKSLYDLSFLYFKNPFFTKTGYFECILDLVKESTHHEAIRSMIELIDLAGKVDEYVDYVLTKECFVHNQREGNTTHIVSRTCIYTTLQKVQDPNSVKRVLAHHFDGTRSAYHDGQEEYVTMMEAVLRRAGTCIKGGDADLAKMLEDYCLRFFNDYHYHFDRDKLSEALLVALRQCYQDAGLTEIGREAFYGKLDNLFIPQEGKSVQIEVIRQTFSMAALWMSEDDVKRDFSLFSSSNCIDMAKASWYREIPYRDVAMCAIELYNGKYPPPPFITKGRERRRKSFQDFSDYAIFKQLVLEMASGLDKHTTRREYATKLRSLEDGYNQYAFRFIQNYPNGEDKYDIEGVVKGIKDKGIYEAFFMKEVVALMDNRDPELPISEADRERCVATARLTVLNLCNGQHPLYFSKDAIELMLKGTFEIPTEKLPCLLNYGGFHITRNDSENIIHGEYSLFEYISERVDEETLAPQVIDLLGEIINRDNYGLSFLLSKYLVDNRIEEGYDLAIRFALSGFYMSDHILDLLIKKGIRINEIKTASIGMTASDRLLCYSLLAKKDGQIKWVKERLEVEFKTYEGYPLKRAVELLVSMGSMEALGYLHHHPELVHESDGFHFNYDNPNAVPSLCFFIGYYYDNHLDGLYLIDSILKSLERIAIKSSDGLLEVNGYLRQLTQRGEPFRFLNRYIISFEDNYYSAFSGIGDIRDAMEIVDGLETEKVASCDEGSAREEDGVFVSYSWEGHSAHIVDFLCFVLENKKIPFKRDRQDCPYLCNIKEFMNALRIGSKVIVVLSRPYLKSRNCMYELSGILADSSYKQRLLPVVVDDTIREDAFYVELVKYWNEQKEKTEVLVRELKAIDPEMAEPEEIKLKEIHTIYGLLKVIKDFIDWTNADNLDALSATRFKSVLDKISMK